MPQLKKMTENYSLINLHDDTRADVWLESTSTGDNPLWKNCTGNIIYKLYGV